MLVPMRLVPAVKAVREAIQNDPDYHETWKSNIAVCLQDEIRRYKKLNNLEKLSERDLHQVTNNAAEEFLKLFCKDV